MMKKIPIFILSILILMSFSACAKNEKSFPANGVLIIGDENHTGAIINRYKENTKEHEAFSVKTGRFDQNRVLILNESTAKAMIKANIFHKRDHSSLSKPLDKLPNFSKESSLLFINEEEKNIKSIEIEGKEIPVTYDSDAWLGNKRDYGALWYIIVAKNSVYKEIKANETTMQLLHLKKSLGDEKPKISTDNTLINEKVKVRKLIEGFKGEVSVQFVTIGEKS
ncbi:lipoprotein BA_5634 family protein [Bacillus albus]|uniref:lipoprotein BA_5634 family protein n=1 Tax=Bacillus sp. FSL R5-0677 TaxID=2921581 RepID=UPI001145D32A|nr:lipoprotein BA_5634 family protein [Bacillus albus]